jgi:gluconokinase
MIIVLIGVAGSGKTTVGTMLADAMGCPFLEGDSLHSKENVDKSPIIASLTSGAVFA